MTNTKFRIMVNSGEEKGAPQGTSKILVIFYFLDYIVG